MEFGRLDTLGQTVMLLVKVQMKKPVKENQYVEVKMGKYCDSPMTVVSQVI